MKINFHAVSFKADQKLLDFTKSKVEKLEQYLDKITGVEVFFKLVNTQGEENKEVEIKLDVPGHDLFAKKHAKTFEEAADMAVEALKNQIRKVKGKEEDQKK